MIQTRDIRVYLFGGIGNVLYQISLSLYLSSKKKSRIQFVKVQSKHRTRFLNEITKPEYSKKSPKFAKSLRVILLKLRIHSIFFRKHIFISLETRVSSLESLEQNNARHYLGYFQNLALAEFAKSDIRKLITDFQHSKWFELMKLKIQADNPIAIHIRRGDYQSTRNYHGILSEDYYLRAINHFPNSEIFWVFSDDLHAARQLLNISEANRKIVYISPPEDVDAVDSLLLFSLCKSQIIANSTFSWWGAFLSNDSTTTIFPKQWILSKGDFEFETPNSWTAIESSWESNT